MSLQPRRDKVQKHPWRGRKLKAQQLQLTAADMAKIAMLEHGERLVDRDGLVPNWD